MKAMQRLAVVLMFSTVWAGTALTVWAQGGDTLLAGEVEKAAGGFRFTEGPVWHPDGFLLFSDIPANKILKWTGPNEVEVFREDSGQSNGLAFDNQGRLIACEHGSRRVSRSVLNGASTAIAETYDGKRLNSPNDCVVRSDGMIFFTDPPYGLGNREREIPFNGVYRVMPDEEPVLLDDTFDRPNGIVLSPDESVLYIADTAKNHVRAFDVDSSGGISNGRVFGFAPNPDGLTIDRDGRVYVTSHEGVVVFNTQGDRVEVIALPETPANCAFGGAENKTLFMTARTSLYAVKLKVPGLPVKTNVEPTSASP